MTDIARLFQASLAPALFVSATALLTSRSTSGSWVSSADCDRMCTPSMTPPGITACTKLSLHGADRRNRATCGDNPTLLSSGAFCSRGYNRVLPASRFWSLLETSCSGGPRRFCSRHDLFAGANLLLHQRSYCRSEFGTERGTRFAVHGPRHPSREPGPQSALNDRSTCGQGPPA